MIFFLNYCIMLLHCLVISKLMPFLEQQNYTTCLGFFFFQTKTGSGPYLDHLYKQDYFEYERERDATLISSYLVETKAF